LRIANCELKIFNIQFAICNEVAIRSRVAGFQGRSTRCAAHLITVIRCALGGNRRLLSPRSSFGGLAAVCETCMHSRTNRARRLADLVHLPTYAFRHPKTVMGCALREVSCAIRFVCRFYAICDRPRAISLREARWPTVGAPSATTALCPRLGSPLLQYLDGFLGFSLRSATRQNTLRQLLRLKSAAPVHLITVMR